MKQIKNERFQEQYVEEVLDNGLTVVLWQKPGFQKSTFVFSTPFGGCDSKQVDEHGNVFEYPKGIAHFLEHKMFEQEDGDALEGFSAIGADVNAFTSYNETAYYFSTTNDPIKPLHMLLDFVQDLHISKESVEKEKGIITQEFMRYQQSSDARLINDSIASIYEEYPLRDDILGTEQSIQDISLEKLYECYGVNYHPARMILVGVSAKDPNLLLKEIKENQSKKKFKEFIDVKRFTYNEPHAVRLREETINMDITTPKVAQVYKFEGFDNIDEISKMEWALSLVLDLLFSPISKNYQTWIDEEIINDTFGYDVELAKDHALIMFTGETNKVDEFHEMIHNTLANHGTFDEELIQNLKHKYFGSNVRALNNFENISIGYIRAFFQGVDFFDSVGCVEDVRIEDLKKAYELIDIDNYTKFQIFPK